MKPETYTAIKSMLAVDGTLSSEETSAILAFCNHPTTHSETETTTVVHQYLSPQEIAEHLHVSDRTVRRWIGSGELPSTKFRGARRVSQNALHDFANGKKDRHGQDRTPSIHGSGRSHRQGGQTAS